ncbi:hypothetical protein [Legionella drancourtii]|uniref:Uncharacterized protein n=1 Tax=Legionella drancourtii LLAP12 TaxID=658187 RepID=G9ESL2_9GAMM|nr:hypothetical protein [Legionella drancourtii]EHL29693.1 hypothetical protein LDG_8283 [Legionella drancourtii LLAP12]
MAQYCITSIILNAYEARIHFDYYLPENNAHWQDRYHGSIDILETVVHGSKLLFDELPIIERIHIRRACWNYLETKGLYRITLVIPLSLYSPLTKRSSR